MTSQLAFKSAAAFPSVLCCFPAPWKGLVKGRDAGSLESGRKQGIATSLSASGRISCSCCLFSLALSPQHSSFLYWLRGQPLPGL